MGENICASYLNIHIFVIVEVPFKGTDVFKRDPCCSVYWYLFLKHMTVSLAIMTDCGERRGEVKSLKTIK